MIPIVLLGVGALVGAVTTYVIQERDKTRLKEHIGVLEKSHRELEEQLARATEREVRHRFERLQLLLQYSRSRLEVLLHERDVPLDRMQRAWSTGKAITMLIQTLPADGTLSAQAERFVELLVKAQVGQKLTRDEIRSLDDYLADQVPGAVREFFEDQLSSMYRQHQRHPRHAVYTPHREARELRALKLREDVEGLHDVALKQVQADATRVEAEYAAAE
ncbi:MAG: hypothetical protein IPJ34_40820, partial [Myxococcales bacterium]|nr:hypothetical protein [Myxococcales bacterium]